MTLKHIPRGQRRKFRNLAMAILDLILHFSMEELKELHDYVEALHDFESRTK